MLIPMWIGPSCRKAAVISRHQSPWSTAGPKSAHLLKSEPPGLFELPAPCATRDQVDDDVDRDRASFVTIASVGPTRARCGRASAPAAGRYRRCRRPRRGPGSGCRPARTSCSRCRSGGRIPSTTARSPGRDGGSTAVASPVSVPGRARPRRLHAGRGRLGPVGDRRRRPAGDLDDRAGAGLRLPARALLRRDRGGAARCGRELAGVARRRRAGGGADRGVRRRRLAARVPRAAGRHADPLDDERDADDPRARPSAATSVLLGSLLNLGAVADGGADARGGRRSSSAPASRERSRSTTPTAPAGSSRCSTAERTRRRDRGRADRAVVPDAHTALNARTYGPPGLEEDILFCSRESVLPVVPRLAGVDDGAAEIVA